MPRLNAQSVPGVAPWLALVVAAITPAAARAQFTWNNAAGGDWSVNGNWLGGAAPAPGPAVALTFPHNAAAGYTANNNIANPFTLNSLTVNNSGTGLVTVAGGALSFGGTNPSMTIAGSGPGSVTAPVALTAPMTVQGAGTGTLTLSGPLSNSATGALVVNSAGIVRLSGGGTLNDGAAAQTAGHVHVLGGRLDLIAGSYTANFFGATGGAAGLGALQVNGGTAANRTQFNMSGGATFGGNAVFFGRYTNSFTASTVSGFGTAISSFDVGTTAAGLGQMIVATRAGADAMLTVSSGGVVNANGTQGLVIAAQEPAVGVVTVTGDDGAGHRSTITATQLRLGGGAGVAGGLGTLNVQAGALVNVPVGPTTNAGNVFLGLQGANGVGTLNVAGTSGGGAPVPSTVNVGFQLIVGGAGVVPPGRGIVNVSGGGLIAVTDITALNRDATTQTSTASVDGAGSRFTGGSRLLMLNGTTSFTVQNGGAATFAGSTAVGANSGSTATLTVAGAGSTYANAGAGANGQLQLGGNNTTPGGTGTLNVNGGGVTVADALVLFAGGTANLNSGALTVGGLAHGTPASLGNAVVATGSTLAIADGLGATFNGVISGLGGLSKGGGGVQTLGGANTYGGGTTINGGKLVVANTAGSGTGGGLVTVAAAGTLGGTGTISAAVTVAGTLAPGLSVGTLNVGSMTWQGGGRYEFEFAGATGDLVAGTGSLNLNGLNAASRYTFHIATIDPSLTTPQTYTVASFATGIIGFDPSPGNPQFLFSGAFVAGSASLALVGNNLRLTFTPVPEPSALLVLCAGAAWVWRRTAMKRPAGISRRA